MIVISLGTDCLFKTYMTELGFKQRRSKGERTMPFDLAIHPYSSVLHFFKNGFENYIQDTDMYENEEGLLCNKRWSTVFVHESNHFKDVSYVEDCWKQETLTYNFIDRNYLELKKRYNRRIKDFKESIQQDKDKFIIFCFHTRNNEHCAELYEHITTNFKQGYLFVLNTHHEPLYDNIIQDRYYYINCPLPNGELWNSNQENTEKVKDALDTTTRRIGLTHSQVESFQENQEVHTDF